MCEVGEVELLALRRGGEFTEFVRFASGDVSVLLVSCSILINFWMNC